MRQKTLSWYDQRYKIKRVKNPTVTPPTKTDEFQIQLLLIGTLHFAPIFQPTPVCRAIDELTQLSWQHKR